MRKSTWDTARAEVLRAEGWTVEKISCEVGASVSAVRSFLQRSGITAPAQASPENAAQDTERRPPMNEPKWTTHRVTMPEDMALEYLDKLLVVVNKQFLDPGYPIALSMAIDKMRAPLPDNKALTVEELREMDGEPVWTVSPLPSVSTGWWIVGKYYDGTATLCGRDNVVYEYGLRNCRISVYRRPPEKGE